METPEATKNPLDEIKEPLLLKAEACADRGDWQGAIEVYNRLLEVDPGDPWTYWERGLIRKVKGELGAALKDFDKAILINPDLSFAYYQRALIKEKNKDKKSAEEDFEKAHALHGLIKVPRSTRHSTRKSASSMEKDGRSYS